MVKVGGNIIMIGNGHKIIAGKDTGRKAIVVGVLEKKPLSALQKQDVIPKRINGIETDVVQTKMFKALVEIPTRTSKWRPAIGGISIGHHDITAGTLGMVVKKNGIKQILSNNHVLANQNMAEIGDAILQPGVADGGTMEDKIAELSKYVPIELIRMSDCPLMNLNVRIMNGLAKLFKRKSTTPPPIVAINNLVDCALATPVSQDDLEEWIHGERTFDRIIPSNEIVEAVIGLPVKKSGRTTELTHGKVTATEVTAQVMMGDGIAIFTDQIAMEYMLAGGDSGSVLLTEDNKLVGLCFAGSDTMSLANRMANVFDALEVDK